MDSLDAELASYPADLMGEAKLRAGLGEREAQSLTMEEKVCNHPPLVGDFSNVQAFVL